MHISYTQNDTVCTQLIFEPTAKSHRLISPAARLPEELIVEILLRLPVRSLLQFKCVCKSWKTLISNPQFTKTHLRISTVEPTLTHQRLVFSALQTPLKIVSYPLKPLFQNPSTPVKPVNFNGIMKHNYSIIGSCNGLLCLYCKSQTCFRLCNPSINFKSKKSPSHCWMLIYYGFGYDQVNDKYKVLVVVQNKDDLSETLTKIYTFGEDSWKIIQNFPHTTPTEGLGKFVSGTLNWIVDKNNVRSNQGVILSFDLAKETCMEILLPQNDGKDMCTPRRKLCVLNNCLCVCDDIYKSGEFHWVVWLMKEYGVVESWTKLMIISREKFQSFVYVIPLFISENGSVLVVDEWSFKLILYNLYSSEFGYPCLLTSSSLGFNPHIYCESLVSL
ncbi:F-box/kelch-repeat protein At3g23880-like [Trifolium pratense]|uniref:Uncharacterized protein n=1 Tax=Trifolium pratense TaxID=57577 RepID=A0ACB0ICY1_TRIPR|nr:F-box/kelch-repeat protein At3g23880-like [Trifolium pratense]CAJ2629798.1 unnamed protein product [Trifolium pratense]